MAEIDIAAIGRDIEKAGAKISHTSPWSSRGEIYAAETRCVRHCRSLLDEVKRLAAIVAKLPRTADGVPIIPGMNLYPLHPLDDDDSDCVVVRFVGEDGEEYDSSTCPPERNYSSAESARIARESIEGGQSGNLG